MNNKTVSLLAVSLILAACGPDNNDTKGDATVDPAAEAQRIAHSSIIVDTHVDLPMRLAMRPANIAEATENGDFDYPRAVSGGLDAPFMSIYTGASLEAEGKSFATAEALIDIVEQMVADAPDKFAIALSPADVRRQHAAGLISLPMGMENGSPIAGDLDNVSYFFDRGIRYITLTHSLSNHLSDSSFEEARQWNGLSEFGQEVVREMNRLGIMIDVSHVSDEAFWQILELSAAPVIASHSSARHFTPGWERNISDEMIVALAGKGGVVQINFGSMFLTAEAQAYFTALKKAGEAYMAQHPELPASFLYSQFPAIYAESAGPFPYATLDNVLDHVDHIVGLVGADHVGLGSDFEGVGDSLPVGLKDVSAYPNLIEGLLRRGYSEADIRKILGENLLRVWEAVEAYAATTSSST